MRVSKFSEDSLPFWDPDLNMEVSRFLPWTCFQVWVKICCTICLFVTLTSAQGLPSFPSIGNCDDSLQFTSGSPSNLNLISVSPNMTLLPLPPLINSSLSFNSTSNWVSQNVLYLVTYGNDSDSNFEYSPNLNCNWEIQLVNSPSIPLNVSNNFRFKVTNLVQGLLGQTRRKERR